MPWSPTWPGEWTGQDRFAFVVPLSFRFAGYLAWLIKEIFLANVNVARIILKPNMPISPIMVPFKATQKSDLGRMIYANSITLTPGTITTGTDGKMFRIHALTWHDVDGREEDEMDRRIYSAGPPDLMFIVTAFALLGAMALAMIRALLGPTVYDRVLAVNMFGTKTVLMIAVLGFLTGRPDFLDLALLYALINFVGTLAVLKFFEYGDLGRRLDSEEEG